MKHVIIASCGRQNMRRLLVRGIASLIVIIALAAAVVVLQTAHPVKASSGVNVLTQHNDVQRTGANLSETTLNTSNVNANSFGKLFSRSVDGYIQAQPLYVSGMTIGGKTRNVVFVATQHDSVYAFDADDPTASTPLWFKNVGPSDKLPDANIGNNPKYGPYTTIQVEIGIQSTPVISLGHNAIYFDAFNKDADGSYHHRLHALDLTTGQEKFGGPIDITASVSGSGYDNKQGTITFVPSQQNQHTSLLYANGDIYVAFSSYADTDPYHGWVLSYNASTLQKNAIWNDTRNGQEGGIWQSDQAPAVDSNGNIYLMTGNGDFDNKVDLGDSLVKLSPSLQVLDWFTPSNYQSLISGDLDLGSSGPLLLPGTSDVIGGGKTATFYLLNTSNLGHLCNSCSQLLQQFQADSNQTSHFILGSPVYWDGPTGKNIYVWPEQSYLRSFAFNGSTFNPTPSSQSTFTAPLNSEPGGFLSLSANGSAAGTGLLWAELPISQNATRAAVPGILRVFDATNLTHELWNSEMNHNRDGLGNLAKLTFPTIANGKVYAATFSNTLNVYGLLPQNGTTTVDDSVIGSGQNQFTYSGSNWTHCSSGCMTGSYDNTISLDDIAGEYATITFTGTQIQFYTDQRNNRGIAGVSIDGGSETTVDLYAANDAADKLIWTSPTLSRGTHTLTIRNTGMKNSQSSGTRLAIDRVAILP